MPGLGTLINAITIVVGGILGLLFGKLIKERVRVGIVSAMGVAVIFIGMDGTIEKFIENYGPSSVNKSIMLVVCLGLGTLIGELADFDGLISRFGEWLKKNTKSTSDGGFTAGFLTSSVTVCVGAMAIVGAIEDGIHGNISVLLIKSLIDFITIMIMTASMGKGCIFSAIPVLILQGGTTLLSGFVAPYLTDAALSNLSLVGSALIFCVGVTLIWKDKLKVANMLPAIVFAVAWAYLPF
ncbi:MAG: DUF554 domain-containing protein [Clostridia bacterium]|nr:DUF554 domain-containing protein [Clostridia bacterium]